MATTCDHFPLVFALIGARRQPGFSVVSEADADSSPRIPTPTSPSAPYTDRNNILNSSLFVHDGWTEDDSHDPFAESSSKNGLIDNTNSNSGKSAAARNVTLGYQRPLMRAEDDKTQHKEVNNRDKNTKKDGKEKPGKTMKNGNSPPTANARRGTAATALTGVTQTSGTTNTSGNTLDVASMISSSSSTHTPPNDFLMQTNPLAPNASISATINNSNNNPSNGVKRDPSGGTVAIAGRSGPPPNTKRSAPVTHTSQQHHASQSGGSAAATSATVAGMNPQASPALNQAYGSKPDIKGNVHTAHSAPRVPTVLTGTSSNPNSLNLSNSNATAHNTKEQPHPPNGRSPDQIQSHLLNQSAMTYLQRAQMRAQFVRQATPAPTVGHTSNHPISKPSKEATSKPSNGSVPRDNKDNKDSKDSKDKDAERNRERVGSPVSNPVRHWDSNSSVISNDSNSNSSFVTAKGYSLARDGSRSPHEPATSTVSIHLGVGAITEEELSKKKGYMKGVKEKKSAFAPLVSLSLGTVGAVASSGGLDRDRDRDRYGRSSNRAQACIFDNFEYIITQTQRQSHTHSLTHSLTHLLRETQWESHTHSLTHSLTHLLRERHSGSPILAAAVGGGAFSGGNISGYGSVFQSRGAEQNNRGSPLNIGTNSTAGGGVSGTAKSLGTRMENSTSSVVHYLHMTLTSILETSSSHVYTRFFCA